MAVLYYNGSVYTGDGFCQGFAVDNGIFTVSGDNSFIRSLWKNGDQLIDLQGRFVCAGFNDSHMHLLSYGQFLTQAQLQDHTDSLKGMLEYVRQWMNEGNYNDQNWLKGRGWNQDYFTDCSRMPTRDDLDAISKDVPIVLARACGHCCVVNSRVLELCGINDDTPDIEGGEIGRESGKLNGLFFDNAISLIQSPVPTVEALKEMIEKGARKLNSFGITSCQSDDYSLFREISPEIINEAYRELISSDHLTVKVYEQANITEIDQLQKFIGEGNVTGVGTDMFRIGPLKLLGDGSLGGRTAHLSIPYADDPGTCGFSLFTPEHLAEMIDLANRNGMQVAVHAIGDRCLDEVLDAIDQALKNCPRKDHRHGIVHCQISRGDQLQRMADMKLHIYAQSVFLDYDNHIVEQRVGKEMADTSYSWKTLMQKGLSVSNGSDAPVEIPDALKGIECAVTRTSLDGTGPYLPEQAFTVREAIDSFTIQSAVASFEENNKGRIRFGYAADFVVLDESPFEVEPTRIHEIRVCSTWLNGREVYHKAV